MLNNLHQSVVERMENLVGSSVEEQREMDAFLLKVIDKIKNNNDKNNIITIHAPSIIIGQTAQYLLTNNGIKISLYGDILAIYLH